MKIFFPILIASILLTALNVFSREKHECTYCHVTYDNTGKMQLKASLNELCIECHPDRRGSKEHKVDIAPSMKVVGLPLSKDGMMTCVTCHDPHEKSGYPMLLRVDPAELCLKCHFK